MGENEIKELLCFKYGQQAYAVELSDVVEICFDKKFYHVPCIPEYFVGICHYKGEIVPVIGMETVKGRNIVLLIRHEAYFFGILLSEEPLIVTVKETEKAQDKTGRELLGGWQEKGIYQKDGNLMFLIDVERTAKELVVYK